MKIGRPKTSKADRKGKITAVRLNPDERRTIDAAAKLQGMSLSEWMRKVLIASAQKNDTVGI